MAVLDDLVATHQWAEHNYLLDIATTYRDPEIQFMVAEATAWLRTHGLIAFNPQQSSFSAIFITRAGREVAANGLTALYVSARLQGNIHPLIEEAARPQFYLGHYELGVFASMKAVEIRVRKLGRYPASAIGRPLMEKAFGENGPLSDPEAEKGERSGVMFLFAGAYSVLRNPAGHREVNYDDVTEAAEAVQLASMLMRILDRAEKRLAP